MHAAVARESDLAPVGDVADHERRLVMAATTMSLAITGARAPSTRKRYPRRPTSVRDPPRKPTRACARVAMVRCVGGRTLAKHEEADLRA